MEFFIVGFPVANSQDFSAFLGVQPGLIFEQSRDGGSDLDVGVGVGAKMKYKPSDELEIAASLGYSYGLNADVSFWWNF